MTKVICGFLWRGYKGVSSRRLLTRVMRHRYQDSYFIMPCLVRLRFIERTFLAAPLRDLIIFILFK